MLPPLKSLKEAGTMIHESNRGGGNANSQSTADILILTHLIRSANGVIFSHILT